MDYKLTRENFCVKEVLYSGKNEQSVEFDCILPDYCPEIFKVLSLVITPSISKHTISGSRLNYEMTAVIKILYSSENGEISSLTQNLNYSKSIDLPYSPKSPCIILSPVTETSGCRVINKRRVDIRGIISVDICVSQDETKQAVSNADGAGIQLKRELITYPSKRLCRTKRVTVIDEVDVGSAKPAVKTVLMADASVISLDKKTLTGKLLTKGEAEVCVLYISEGSNDIESIKFTLPFSQISDIEGLDDRYDLFVDAFVQSCELRPCANGDQTKNECELSIEIRCTALRFESTELACDAYSTKYKTDISFTDAEIECMPVAINETHKQKTTLTYSEGEICAVLSAGACAGRVTATVNESANELVLKGKMTVNSFAKNESGKIIYLESAVPFEYKLPLKGNCSQSAQAYAAVTAVQYNLLSSNAIEVTVEMKIKGYLFEVCDVTLISDISVDKTQPIVCDDGCAVKLYFAQAGEEPWEIAKRCNTSVKAIMEENDLEGERLLSSGMLLIPMSN